VKAYIEERAIEVANFIIQKNATVRETAKKFGISKSTAHLAILSSFAYQRFKPNSHQKLCTHTQ